MFNPFKKTIVTRMVFFMVFDVILIIFSIYLAFLFRFDGQIPQQYFPFIYRMIGLTVIFTIPVFYFSGLYYFSWAYVSAAEAISLFKATVVSFIFLTIAIFISNYFPRFSNFPRSIIFISYFLIFIFCGGLRFAKRIYSHFIRKNKAVEKEKTLIVGAGDAGEQVLRGIFHSKTSPYNPVGFIDDSPMKQGIAIHGLKILGKILDIPKIVEKYGIKQLIIALPTAGSKTIQDAIGLGRKAGIKKIKILPHINEIIKGEFFLRNLRDIDAGELLGRGSIGLDKGEIENFIKNKTILITGAAGSIGSELSRQVAKFKPSLLLLLDQDETGIFNISEEIKNKFSNLKTESFIADIRDKNKIERIFQKSHPQIVFHAAAYKHVPLMEENPDEAIKNNIFGTKIVADASLNSGSDKFIFVSTDKAVNPTSVMGATKRIGEMICQILNQEGQTRFISVRFGNVLDSRGSVIPTFREQIKKGGPIEVTHPEMKRYFMLTSEACLLVMQAGAMGKGGEVFILDMGKPIKILDLAKEMIKLSGLEPDKDIAIVFSGKRPGEKLFEEILTAEEGTIATKNQKIFVAKLTKVESSKLKECLEELNSSILTLVGNGDGKEKIKSYLEKILPLYKPDNF